MIITLPYSPSRLFCSIGRPRPSLFLTRFQHSLLVFFRSLLLECARMCVCVCVCVRMHTFLFCKRSTGLSTTPSSSVESTTYAAVQRSVDTLLPSSHSLISSCQQQHHLQNYMYAFVLITFKLLILYTCTHRLILKKS